MGLVGSERDSMKYLILMFALGFVAGLSVERWRGRYTTWKVNYIEIDPESARQAWACYDAQGRIIENVRWVGYAERR